MGYCSVGTSYSAYTQAVCPATCGMCVVAPTTDATLFPETGLSPFAGVAVAADTLVVRFPPPNETVDVVQWHEGILRVLDVEVGVDPRDVTAVNLYEDNSILGGEVVAAVSLGSDGRAQMLQIELSIIGYRTLAMRVDGDVRVGVVQVADVANVAQVHTTSAPSPWNNDNQTVVGITSNPENDRYPHAPTPSLQLWALLTPAGNERISMQRIPLTSRVS